MSSLRTKFTWSLFYTALARYSGVVISIVVSAFLARLLTPTEFGIVAIVTVFTSFFNLLSSFGLGPAIIQNKTLNAQDISGIFSVSVLLSFLFAAFFFLCSWLIADFYKNSALILITQLLAIAVFFYSLRVIPYSLSLKDLDFKRIGLITVVVQLLSGVVAIVLAYKGYSYFALVYKTIFDAVVSAIVFYCLKPIKMNRKLSAVKKVLSFSSYQFSFNFINYFSRNSDNLLIGRFLSASSLGYYEKSYQLMMMPVANLTYVISQVMHPVLSTYQSDKKKIFEIYSKILKILSLIGFPLSVFLYFSSKNIVLLLYGEQWLQSVPVFKILSISVGIQMVLSSSGAIFQAVNRTDLLFISGLISAVFMVSGISYGVFYEESLIGIGYGLLFAFVINFFVGFYLLIEVALGESIIYFFKCLLPGSFLWNFSRAFILYAK